MYQDDDTLCIMMLNANTIFIRELYYGYHSISLL